MIRKITVMKFLQFSACTCSSVNSFVIVLNPVFIVTIANYYFFLLLSLLLFFIFGFYGRTQCKKVKVGFPLSLEWKFNVLEIGLIVMWCFTDCYIGNIIFLLGSSDMKREPSGCPQLHSPNLLGSLIQAQPAI